jgi:hypothetical protein
MRARACKTLKPIFTKSSSSPKMVVQNEMKFYYSAERFTAKVVMVREVPYFDS